MFGVRGHQWLYAMTNGSSSTPTTAGGRTSTSSSRAWRPARRHDVRPGRPGAGVDGAHEAAEIWRHTESSSPSGTSSGLTRWVKPGSSA